MNDDRLPASCGECGAALPDPLPAACPNCGSSAKTYAQRLSATATAKAELTWVHERREIIRKRPWIRPTLLTFDLALLVGGFFLAQWVGFAIGAVLVVASELLAPKTIERITRISGKA